MPLPLARLASLDLLKGFVAVGRRMSITLAADDLFLTQSAVSRQVRALEDRLGVKLLLRKHRGIAFTDDGERLFRSADAALQRLQDVMDEIGRGGGRTRPVTVTASIGVTGLWLLPRMGRLQARWPRLDVRLSASNRVADLRADGIDLGVRYARDGMALAGAVRLFGETVAPVAHPSLIADLTDGADALARLPLLEFDDPRPWLQWRAWLGAQPAAPRGLLRFNQYDQVIHAALAGQGVALGRLELIHALLDVGQLVRVPLSLPPVASPNAYWLIQADDDPRDDVRRVADWIREEAGATAAARARQAAALGASPAGPCAPSSTAERPAPGGTTHSPDAGP